MSFLKKIGVLDFIIFAMLAMNWISLSFAGVGGDFLEVMKDKQVIEVEVGRGSLDNNWNICQDANGRFAIVTSSPVRGEESFEYAYLNESVLIGNINYLKLTRKSGLIEKKIGCEINYFVGAYRGGDYDFYRDLIRPKKFYLKLINLNKCSIGFNDLIVLGEEIMLPVYYRRRGKFSFPTINFCNEDPYRGKIIFSDVISSTNKIIISSKDGWVFFMPTLTGGVIFYLKEDFSNISELRSRGVSFFEFFSLQLKLNEVMQVVGRDLERRSVKENLLVGESEYKDSLFLREISKGVLRYLEERMQNIVKE